MHLRKLVLACGFASFALSNYASALGLGEVKLKSALNQPLSAEVQLLDTRDLSAEQILVALASSADFERNGVERLYFYTEFQFQVVMDSPGGPVVRITTRNPVREPYLNFLIEARWTSGRLLREYTVLMDLPTFDDAAPKAVQSPATAAPKAAPAKPQATQATQASSAKVEAPAVSQEPSKPAAAVEEKPAIIAEQDQPAKKPKAVSGSYGPIGSKDTLWDIATSVRPDSSVTVHQTMLALQRLNPDAFIRGNINLIKKGQVLRVPEKSEMTSLSKAEALAQVNTQNAQWASGSSSAATGLGAQLDATKHVATSRREAEPMAGRVKLEAPASASKTANGQGSGSNKGSGKALESELAATLEELDKAKSEKTELSSRVHDLEAQVKTMQRLVDVSNEKLRAMQLNASKQVEKPAEKAAAVVDKSAADKSAKSSAPAAASVAAAQVSSAAVSSAIASSSSSVASSVAVQPKPIITAPAAAQKSLADQLKDNILWVGLGAVGLLGGGLVALRRRKAQAETAAAAETEELIGQDQDFSAFGQAEQEQSQEPQLDEMAEFEEEDTDAAAVAETGDVVGEADIYIAYGKYDQAEEMLLNGLAKDPDSTDIRLKLLEVYSHVKNAVDFDKHYAAILPVASAFALNRAAELRANIPDAGEFVGTAEAAIASAPLFDEDFSLNDDHPALAADVSSPEDEFSFDLNLDDASDLDSELETASKKYDMDLSDNPVAEDSNVGLDDDFSLDFDLPEPTAAAAPDFDAMSLELDSLDAEEAPGASAAPALDDEFNFDFNELDNANNAVAEAAASVESADLPLEDDAAGDDFNFELDVNDVDLAALDHEMESLDADLDSLDDELEPAGSADTLAALDAELDANLLDDELAAAAPAFAAEPAVSEQAGDEFSLDDLEFEAAPVAPVADVVAHEAGLGDDEFSWDEDEPELDDSEFAPENPEQDDLSLAEDDFDLDSLAASDDSDELSFEELDASFDSELPDLAVEDDGLLDLSDEALAAEGALDDDLALENFDALAPQVDEPSEESLSEELLPELAIESSAEFESLDTPAELHNTVAEPLSADDEFEVAEDVVEAAHELDFDELDLDENLAAHAEVADEVAKPVAEFEVADDVADLDDDLFEQALSDFSADSLQMNDAADMSDEDMDAELDFMADADEAATKLDLARAYIDMGDSEGARDILSEVAQEGNEQQRQEAVELLSRIDA